MLERITTVDPTHEVTWIIAAITVFAHLLRLSPFVASR